MSTWSTTEGISAYFVLFSFLLAVVLILSKILHDHPNVAAILPEAGLIIMVGIVAGFVINFFVPEQVLQNFEGDDDVYVNEDNVAQSLLSFSPEVFFIGLLPPIIFNSGYHLRRELFFRHLTPIVLFAVIGTVVSAFTIAAILHTATLLGLTGNFSPTLTELLTFGALISATDPVSTLAVFQAKRVDPQLFYLVFGESVLNDAVGLVLFKSFGKFVVKTNDYSKIAAGIGEFFVGFAMDSLGSPILGIGLGCASAVLFKHLDMRKSRLLELSLYILIMYVPFMLAEMFGLSGIVTILFTGMTAKAYVVPNLSESTVRNADVLFRLAAHISETSIFLELGLSVFGMKGNLKYKFLFWALFACLIARALNVYPITGLFNFNLRREDSPLPGIDSYSTTDHRSMKSDNASHVEMSDVNNDYNLHTDRFADSETGKTRNASGMLKPEKLLTSCSIISKASMTPRNRRDLKINPSTAHMLWFSGLRGAVAYACARSFPDNFGHQKEFVVTTMAIVLVTVFALGSTTEMALHKLQIETGVEEEEYMEEWYRQRAVADVILQLDEWMEHKTTRPQSDEDDSQNSKVEKFIREPSVHSIGSGPVLHPSLQYHVEMTEAQHLENVKGMKRRFKRKESSMYDFGGDLK